MLLEQLQDLFDELYINKYLFEGINDPHIYKAIFMAGGGGSGKSFIANHMFKGIGLKFVNTDEAFETLLKLQGIPMEIDPTKLERYKKQTKVRNYAKALTKIAKKHYLNGMLGLVIDGTAKEYGKITKTAQKLKEAGYDVGMVFVNTTLDVALERNQQRERSVPIKDATNAWHDVQENLPKFKSFFGNENFFLVDNSKKLTKQEINSLGKKLRTKALNWMKKPLQNEVGKKIIDALRKTKGKTLSDLASSASKAA